MRIDPAATAPTYTTFAGEGVVKTLAQGPQAVVGVASHEAANLRVFEAQAARNDQEIVSKSIEVQFAYNPETHRVEVVGGRSRVQFHDKDQPAGGAAARNGAESGGVAPGGAGGDAAVGASGGPGGGAPGRAEAAGGPGDSASALSSLAGQATTPAEEDEHVQLLDDIAGQLRERLETLETKERTEADQGDPKGEVPRIKDQKVEIKQQIQDLERQKQQIEMERRLKEVNDVVNQAVSDTTAAALGGAQAPPAQKRRGRGAPGGDPPPEQLRKAFRGPSRGLFTPSFTVAGFFVNTSA